MELIHCWGHNPLCTMKAELIHWVNTFSVTYTLSSFSLTPNRFTSKSWKENQLFFFFLKKKPTDLAWNAFGFSIQGITWTDIISFLPASHSSFFILARYNGREHKDISPSITCFFLLPVSLTRHCWRGAGRLMGGSHWNLGLLKLLRSVLLAHSKAQGEKCGTEEK